AGLEAGNRDLGAGLDVGLVGGGPVAGPDLDLAVAWPESLNQPAVAEDLTWVERLPLGRLGQVELLVVAVAAQHLQGGGGADAQLRVVRLEDELVGIAGRPDDDGGADRVLRADVEGDDGAAGGDGA